MTSLREMVKSAFQGTVFKLIHWGQFTTAPILQITFSNTLTWHRIGNKPLSEPKVV